MKKPVVGTVSASLLAALALFLGTACKDNAKDNTSASNRALASNGMDDDKDGEIDEANEAKDAKDAEDDDEEGDEADGDGEKDDDDGGVDAEDDNEEEGDDDVDGGSKG